MDFDTEILEEDMYYIAREIFIRRPDFNKAFIEAIAKESIDAAKAFMTEYSKYVKERKQNEKK